MAISSSTSFIQTRDQLIYDAFELLGVYGLGRTVSNEDMTFAVNVLNKMIKAWGTKGLHLWCKEEAILYLTPYTSKYRFGTATNPAYCSLEDDTVITQTSAAAISGATSLTVKSTTGMTIGDYIGVTLADNTLFWTTIAALPSSTSITLTGALTGAVSSAFNVYTFTTLINMPYRVLSCRRISGYDAGATTTISENIMTALSHQDYYNLPNKTSNGIPNQYYYDPQVNFGDLFVWPRPADCVNRIGITYERRMSDVIVGTDNFDFPQEWLEPITWMLASRIGPAFGKGKRVNEEIYPIAKVMLEQLLDFDTEIVSVCFQLEDQQ
jgi:hypothetical protein